MSNVVIKVENLSKQYRLGEVGTGTLSNDLNRWWHRVRGKPNPYLKIGETNDRATKGNSELVWALKNIEFEVKQGEVLGIIGRNGAGKSTLLKILSKVTGPTNGRIRAKGHVASLLEVGTGFHPELTGKENVYLNGTILGMKKKEVDNKFEEIINFAGVERYIDTPVKRYSSGMMVRLGFSVAAHLEPEILIVDEVLAVGDAEFQRKCLGKMNSVANQDGRTILFVSHNMGSIVSLCSRSLLLHNGELKNIGNTENIINEYLNLNKTKQKENLSENKDRKGAGNILIQKIDILEYEPSDIPFSIGTKISIKIHYKCNNSFEFNNINVIIGIYNNLNEGISRFDSNATANFSKNLPQEGIIQCKITDKINLMPGVYYLNVAILSNGVMQDYLAQKVSFEIVDGNYFGTGKLFSTSNLAKIALKHQWTIE